MVYILQRRRNGRAGPWLVGGKRRCRQGQTRSLQGPASGWGLVTVEATGMALRRAGSAPGTIDAKPRNRGNHDRGPAR